LSCPHGQLLPSTVLGADDDISEGAFVKLCSAGVHSLPVSAGGQVIGMLDLADFARLAVKIYTTQEGTQKLSVRDCMNLSGNNKFVCLSKNATVLQALESINSVHQHRICIALDKKDKSTVFALLSQIDLVNYFLNHIEELGAYYANKTVAQLGGKKYLGYRKRQLVSVDVKDSVLYAVQLMDRHAITGLPVLKDGRIYGTVSLSDVPFALNSLLGNVQAFIDAGKGREMPLSHGVASVDGDCSFGSLLKGFAVSGFHRLWLVDGDLPIGVISLTDVMRCLLTFVTEQRDSKSKK